MSSERWPYGTVLKKKPSSMLASSSTRIMVIWDRGLPSFAAAYLVTGSVYGPRKVGDVIDYFGRSYWEPVDVK